MGRSNRKRPVQSESDYREETTEGDGGNPKRMKTKTVKNVQSSQAGRRNEDWRENDLVLDEIFKNLKMKDLKVAREVCKKWCFVATRLISREAAMTIGDRRSELETQTPTPHTTLTRKATPMKYTNIKEFLMDSRDAVFETGFRPVTIQLLGCANVWRLPKWTFDKLKTLNITHFVTEDADRLLWGITQDLPDLLSLSLIGSYPVLCKSRRRRAAPKGGKTAMLEHLELTIPFIWCFSWEFMNTLPKLKSLKINQEGFGQLGDVSNRAHFVDCIDKFPTETIGPRIDTLALEFNIHVSPASTEGVVNFVSRLQLRKLELFMNGSPTELLRLIQRIKLPSESISIKLLTVQGFNQVLFAAVFEEFKSRGYLKLKEWSFTIREPGSGFRMSTDSSLYAEFKLTKEYLVFQNYTMAMTGGAQSIDKWIAEQFPSLFPGYTYACVLSPGNQNVQYEIIDEKGIQTFKTDIIPRERVLLYNGCSNTKCAKLQKHLVSYPGFRDALNLKNNWVHNAGSWGVNYQYYKVPRKVLETYKTKLVRRHYSIRQADYCCKPKMLSNLYISTNSGIKTLKDLALVIYMTPCLKLAKVGVDPDKKKKE